VVLDYIEIADTWKWERDPNAKYVTQYIRVLCKQGSWQDMAKLLEEFNPEAAIEQGKILMKRLEMDVEKLAKKSHPVYINGIEVEAVNSGHDLSISDLGHALAVKSKSGIGLVYNYAYGEMKMSFRGLEGTSIAREVAEFLGGGGHNAASGARMSLAKFLTLLPPTEG
jgi:oligoribonuclease NrnB/cAMP/cGMP phosphodiesterase (DHH superfamily)